MPEKPARSEGEDSARRLPKTFTPSMFEETWYRLWDSEGRFQPSGPASSPRFVMVIPPPNVTGRLHIGHAYGRTVEDILARWKRMRGLRVLWVPGTDHAGIATQMVIERQLAKEGLDRRQLGREKFVERVWAWKREAKDTIQSQLKRLGCSLDWTRERFTMDADLSRAVRHAFVRLYQEGLIYKGRYVVNWCPGCHTAVSDLEVVDRKTKGTLYKIRYDVPGVRQGAVVATTRPETMLGDTALAIHPDDPRNARLKGKKAVLPIVGRDLPVIEDPVLVDREFGTGIVKVTPAHDANDFASGQRHGLPAVVVIGPDAKMTAEAGEYAGLDRFEARKRIVERLEKEGRVVAAEPYEIALGACQRSDDVIEPYLSEQWFVKVAPLAARALEAVEAGRIRFVPENWNKSFFSWMRNIRDWCISRQLWWGHRIPAFTCGNGHVTVADEDPAECPVCGRKDLVQDPDVLDTWFSSQLWPFSVFGWPDQTPDLAEFYPTDVLVTGYDILFFWVARMIMAGLFFTGREPFAVVHLHGLVRVGGEKMSKTRGNVIDPLEAIGEFGADAVRFALASAAAGGDSVAVEKGRMAGSRNFATKLWNAARLALSHIEGRRVPALPGRPLSLADRWILSRLAATAAEVNRQLGLFRFDEAAQAIYAFVWDELCDVYLEVAKPILAGSRGGEEAADTVRAVLQKCLEDAVALLHPFMPFVTEEIWEKLTGRPGTLIVAKYPEGESRFADPKAEAAMAALRQVVTRVRNFRTERGAPPTEPVELSIAPDSPAAALLPDLEILSPQIAHLARLSVLRFAAPAAGASRDVVAGLALGLALARPVSGAETSRIVKTLADLDEEIENLDSKLRNPAYVEKAPAPVVEKTRRRLDELKQRRAALSEGRP
jgi:valyl-tRNA synthetase